MKVSSCVEKKGGDRREIRGKKVIFGRNRNRFFYLLLPTFIFSLAWSLFSVYSEALAYERAGGINVGGYGSQRLLITDDEISFTMRRFVPTFSTTIGGGRVKFYAELEFERFLLIELEESLSPSGGGLEAKTELEGIDGAEIKMEQVWGEFEMARWLRFRIGGVLPPVGRFNLLHDDDLWEPARRPYSIRDMTVLPETVAWMEYGAGFLGDFEIGDMLAGYELYVLQGVVIDQDMEFVVSVGQRDEGGEQNILKMESVIKMRSGSGSRDVKKEKAISGRFRIVPALGYEFAFSTYFGRYTPDFLIPANILTLAFDFRTDITTWLSIEGEGAYTMFGKLDDVMRDIVRKAVMKEGEFVQDSLKVVSELTFANKFFASEKMGGWILFRFPFFPSSLRGTFLDVEGESKFVLFFRPEYVLWRGRVDAVEFEGGQIKEIKKSDVQAVAGTFGIAYRPVETFVFSLSYERFQGTEMTKNYLLFGFAYGF